MQVPDAGERNRLRPLRAALVGTNGFRNGAIHTPDPQNQTQYIAADRWTMGDIGIGLRVHRWHLFEIEPPQMPRLARYYAAIRARPAFASIADPAYHGA